MPNLLSPLLVRGVTLRNRIASSSASDQKSEDGFIQNHQLTKYGSQAAGGAGLVMTEVAAIEEIGRRNDKDLGIWKDDHLPGMRRLVRLVKQQGAVAGLRIGHAGFRSEEERNSLSPPCLRLLQPDGFTEELLGQTIRSFQLAAERSYKSGFEVLEIQANKGDLLHQMLSGLLNQRTDTYGGNFRNRVRFLQEVISSIRKSWPKNLPLFLRLAATDYSDCPDSWQLMDAVRLSREVQQLGVDLITPSGGGLQGEAIRDTPDRYQVSLSWAIRKQGNVPTGVLGVPMEFNQANRVLKHEMADLVVVDQPLFLAPAPN